MLQKSSYFDVFGFGNLKTDRGPKFALTKNYAFDAAKQAPTAENITYCPFVDALFAYYTADCDWSSH